MNNTSITLIVLFILGIGFIYYLFEVLPQQRLEQAIQNAPIIAKAVKTCSVLYPDQTTDDYKECYDVFTRNIKK